MTEPSEPTVALREYIEARLDALDERMKQRADLEQKAVHKAEEAMSARLEGMNELRAAMRDQTGLFLTRDAFDAKYDSLITRVGLMENRLATFDARTAMLVSMIAVAVSALVEWFVHRG